MKNNPFKVIVILLIVVGFIYLALDYISQQGKRSRASGEIIDLIYDPSSANPEVNTDFTVSFKIKPSVDIALRGYRIKLIFDKTKLEIKNIEYKLGTVSSDLGDTNNNLANINKTGILSVIGEIPSATGYTLTAGASTELIKLTFKKLVSAGTTFKIDINDASFYAFNSDMVLFEVPLLKASQFDVNGGGALVTPSIDQTSSSVGSNPTITQTITGNVKISLKLKLQGIGKLPIENLKSTDIKVKLKKEGTTNILESSSKFTADSNGFWSGTVGFNINDVSGNWLIYVKGPQHLQKKICDVTPSETNPGIYSCSDGKITLKAGENNFDFSKITLLVGDLDGNGIVDAVDYGLVKNNLGKKDAEILKKADLNRDGLVDTQDFSLILYALSVKTDEM